jgi:hypothetical protein
MTIKIPLPEKYERFFEMATIDKIKDFVVTVYTDHEPAHFHVTKKDCYEVRLSISNLKILSYKWQNDGEEVSSKDLKTIRMWLSEKNKKQKTMTNKEAVKFTWDILNNK